MTRIPRLPWHWDTASEDGYRMKGRIGLLHMLQCRKASLVAKQHL